MGFQEFLQSNPSLPESLQSVPQESILSFVGAWEAGETVPFLFHYQLDRFVGITSEGQCWDMIELKDRFSNLQHRQQTIIENIEKSGKLTPELKVAIETSWDAFKLEDIYAPFRPKSKTRGGVASEKGLSQLAQFITLQGKDHPNAAKNFLNPAKGVTTVDEALAGALDIVAEAIADDRKVRSPLRALMRSQGRVSVKPHDRLSPDKEKRYKEILHYSSSVEELFAVPHRILALFRAEQERALTVQIDVPAIPAMAILDETRPSKPKSTWVDQLQSAKKDAWERLLKPALEVELRQEMLKKAHEFSISLSCQNLRQLLLAAPFGSSSVLAIDPGFQNGCVVAALDAGGALLEHAQISPNEPTKDWAGAAATLVVMLKKHQAKAIVVGDGTAGRTTLQFVRDVIRKGIEEKILDEELPAVVLDEVASIWIAKSDYGRMEFSDLDERVRTAISLGRRFQDPLVELVKVDPRELAVGLYQSDVNQGLLKKRLDQVVMSVVNFVGVDLNKANFAQLSFVAGLGPSIARAIIDTRNELKEYTSREQLLQIKKMTPSLFRQCAGFLRVGQGIEASRIHPEHYPVAAQIKEGVMAEGVGQRLFNLVQSELANPGQDPRRQFEFVRFSDQIKDIKDLQKGAELPGVVTNLTSFGAFVDVGLAQDGLVHLSEMSDAFIKDPSQVLYLGQPVTVRVLHVDLDKKKISFSLREAGVPKPRAPRPPQQRVSIRPANSQGQLGGGQSIKKAVLPAKNQSKTRPSPKPTFNSAFAGLADLKGSFKK